jgi:threonine/homoserine/homoserine lactone efflux protein
MHYSTSILIGAFTLGFVGGAIPGPVLTTIFTEIIETNFTWSLRVLFWAMLLETAVRLSALLLVGSLPLNGVVFQSLSLLGAAVLLRIAAKVWRMRTVGQGSAQSFGFWTLALMIVSNGMMWTYWLTACVPDAMALGREVPYGEYLFLLVFELGWFASTFLMMCLFASFKRVLSNSRVMPILFKCFALVFAGFALHLAIGSFRYVFVSWLSPIMRSVSRVGIPLTVWSSLWELITE